ncbi:MAG TPA: TIGR00153 family protein [Gammaproteobacteria bacterium]|nr:TIGR00153 family protein [Gammaproteobacteria bacterium]
MWPFNRHKKKDSISSLWGVLEGSPFYLLRKHMKASVSCCSSLDLFMQAAFEGDWELAKKHQLEVIRMELVADRLKNKLKLHMHKGLLLPVSRSDLLSILTAQDNIANTVKDIVGIIYGRRMSFPMEIRNHLTSFYKTSILACNQAHEIVDEISDLFQSGFSAKMIQSTEDMISKLDEIEEKTDLIQIEVRKVLFEHESNMPPVDVVFLYQVIQDIGHLADWAQRVGAKLLLLLAR